MHLRMLQPKAFDVSRLQDELLTQPELWNAIRLRTEHPKSPHREVSDIWLRYNPIENYHGDMPAFNAEHTPEWYPAAGQLPDAMRIAEDLMRRVIGAELGAVLITKIPAGCQVYPHIDQGWHARTFEKFAVQVRGNAEQAFHFQDEKLVTRDGDLYWFENQFPHWVTNSSQEDRITLIVCIRR